MERSGAAAQAPTIAGGIDAQPAQNPLLGMTLLGILVPYLSFRRGLYKAAEDYIRRRSFNLSVTYLSEFGSSSERNPPERSRASLPASLSG
jgi:hypothetical protein